VIPWFYGGFSRLVCESDDPEEDIEEKIEDCEAVLAKFNSVCNPARTQHYPNTCDAIRLGKWSDVLARFNEQLSVLYGEKDISLFFTDSPFDAAMVSFNHYEEYVSDIHWLSIFRDEPSVWVNTNSEALKAIKERILDDRRLALFYPLVDEEADFEAQKIFLTKIYATLGIEAAMNCFISNSCEIPQPKDFTEIEKFKIKRSFLSGDSFNMYNKAMKILVEHLPEDKIAGNRIFSESLARWDPNILTSTSSFIVDLEILSFLGRGTFGGAFLAKKRSEERAVVVKLNRIFPRPREDEISVFVDVSLDIQRSEYGNHPNVLPWVARFIQSYEISEYGLPLYHDKVWYSTKAMEFEYVDNQIPIKDVSPFCETSLLLLALRSFTDAGIFHFDLTRDGHNYLFTSDETVEISSATSSHPISCPGLKIIDLASFQTFKGIQNEYLRVPETFRKCRYILQIISRVHRKDLAMTALEQEILEAVKAKALEGLECSSDASVQHEYFNSVLSNRDKDFGEIGFRRFKN
jgi:hypothetical protein